MKSGHRLGTTGSGGTSIAITLLRLCLNGTSHLLTDYKFGSRREKPRSKRVPGRHGRVEPDRSMLVVSVHPLRGMKQLLALSGPYDTVCREGRIDGQALVPLAFFAPRCQVGF